MEWSLFSGDNFIIPPSFLKSERYLAQTITDADNADDIALLANTPAQAEPNCIAWNEQLLA